MKKKIFHIKLSGNISLINKIGVKIHPSCFIIFFFDRVKSFDKNLFLSFLELNMFFSSIDSSTEVVVEYDEEEEDEEDFFFRVKSLLGGGDKDDCLGESEGTEGSEFSNKDSGLFSIL